MITLGIDTSNQPLSVGLINDNKVMGQVQTAVKKNHSITLMPAVDELVKSVGLVPADIDRIAVAHGPGSYTGLRIGVTVAKTLACTLDKELVGISSLKVLAANCLGVDGWIVPLFDARRNNVYTGIYQWQNGELAVIVKDRHIPLDTLLEKIGRDKKVYFTGLDTEKFAEQILEKIPSAVINQVPLWDLPSGAVLAQLAEKETPAENVHGFLPKYLKRVEAEEKWLETHTEDGQGYVEKI